jgi:hypothetical protein
MEETKVVSKFVGKRVSAQSEEPRCVSTNFADAGHAAADRVTRWKKKYGVLVPLSFIALR